MEYRDLLNFVLDEVVCPVCHQKCRLKNIKFRGAFEGKAILACYCFRHPKPVRMILIFSLSGGRQAVQPIRWDDYLDLKNALKNSTKLL